MHPHQLIGAIQPPLIGVRRTLANVPLPDLLGRFPVFRKNHAVRVSDALLVGSLLIVERPLIPDLDEFFGDVVHFEDIEVGVFDRYLEALFRAADLFDEGGMLGDRADAVTFVAHHIGKVLEQASPSIVEGRGRVAVD